MNKSAEMPISNSVNALFRMRLRSHGVFHWGLPEDGPELSTAAFRRPEGAQLGLAL